jgi:hypothetical protein
MFAAQKITTKHIKDVVMNSEKSDNEKSRQFYQERYYRAIKEFGVGSLTAKICKKKLELLNSKDKQRTSPEGSTSHDKHTEEET